MFEEPPGRGDGDLSLSSKQSSPPTNPHHPPTPPYGAHSINQTAPSTDQSIILPNRHPPILHPPGLKRQTPRLPPPLKIRIHQPRPLPVATPALRRDRTGEPALGRRPREGEGSGVAVVGEAGRVGGRGGDGFFFFVGGGEGEGAVFGDVDGLAEGDVGVLDRLVLDWLGLEEGW